MLTRRLREMDVVLMQRLSPRVNVIPVLGRADSMTVSELKAFKKRVSYQFFVHITQHLCFFR